LKGEVRNAKCSSSEAIVKVSLGKFVRSSFETRFGADFASVMRQACIHYARRLRSGRKPLGAPNFYRRHGTGGSDSGLMPVEFPLDDRIMKQLEWEARRQHLSMDEMFVHAALVYLADLDAAPTS
jgi:hypothetical protein